MDKAKISAGVKLILEGIGENPDRAGLQETPKRVAQMYSEIFDGIKRSPAEIIKTIPDEEHDEIVLIKDIPFYSICEHHLLPFIGKAHVAYIPDGYIVGLSKIARLVDVFAKRPQLQERLTTEVADTIMNEINPLGVLVVVEAEHLCMTMRGIKAPGSQTVTSAVRGVFMNEPAARSEALSLINR
jgi:GTP cyclohydrolase I